MFSFFKRQSGTKFGMRCDGCNSSFRFSHLHEQPVSKWGGDYHEDCIKKGYKLDQSSHNINNEINKEVHK